MLNAVRSALHINRQTCAYCGEAHELRELTAFAQELCDLSDRATLPRFRKHIAVANKDRVGGWLLYLDIDNLEQVQRRHGDEAMNEAVLRTAQMLHKTLRVHDVVARVTRSGFAAMISLPPRYPPNYITARIRGALQLANRHAAKQYNVELAMGLAQMAAHAPVQDALERAAAEAALTAPGRQRAPLA